MRPTAKSRSSSTQRRAKTQVLDRPFDPGILAKAAELAAQYRLVLESDGEGGYLGSSIEFPTAVARGATAETCVESTRRALAAAVAVMLEAGRRPPTPALQRKRELQINVRLSAEEKLVLEEAAQRCGFKGISDFVRTAALDRATAA